MKRLLIWVLAILVSIFLGLWLLVFSITYHPAEEEIQAVVCPAKTPEMISGQKIKVLNWNVQYMASKNYVFFYDLPPDMPDRESYDLVTMPSEAHVYRTLDEVARIIKDENPDIILLQEMHEDSAQTYYIDQVAELRKRLPAEYSCFAEALYWKADFVPSPDVWGSVGMKSVTMSKYKINSAIRYQLEYMPNDILTKQFYLKRAILSVEMPVQGGPSVVAMNTHLDAFAQGSNTMEEQVKEVHEKLTKINSEAKSWFIGGDFNLLPPDLARETLHETVRGYYKPESEIKVLFKDFASTATTADLQGARREKYFTHTPNHPLIEKPDRTIDYIFYNKKIKMNSYTVRQHDTLKISDHLPMIVEFTLP